MYHRGTRTDPEIIDVGEYGFGWIAAPTEGSRRASHAVEAGDQLYLFDPLAAQEITDKIDGHDAEVAGVCVLSSYHTRDAKQFANRYNVPVIMPEQILAILDQFDAPTVAVEADKPLGATGFQVTVVEIAAPFQKALPIPRWREAIAYREEDGTLYTPDLLSRGASTSNETIGVYPLARPNPPKSILEGLQLQRILSGHGRGVFEDPEAKLNDAVNHARLNIPKAILENGYRRVKLLYGAVRG